MIRHVDAELHDLRELILKMGGCVEKALDEVFATLNTKDLQRLREVHAQEERINQLQIEIDQACVNMLAKQAPVARDLRLVIAVIKINTDLERMGDQAVNIAHCVTDVVKLRQGLALPNELGPMMSNVRGMVRAALNAFVKRDVNVCQEILKQDDQVDQQKDQLIQQLQDHMRKSPEHIESAMNMIMIAKNLERLADHATNIAEEVIFLATGDDVRHGHVKLAGG